MKVAKVLLIAGSMMLSGSVFANPTADSLSAGQCMGKVYKPAVYKSETVRVLKVEAGQKVQVIPAKFEWVEKKVEIAPAYTIKKVVPAKYKMVKEKVVDKAEHVVVKNGGDSYSGEVMCKVKVPATYKTITKREMIEGPKTIDQTIEAKYKVFKVKQLVQDEQVVTKDIPEEYSEYTKKALVSPAQVSWQRVLCKTNSNQDTVLQLQKALKTAGYNPGTMDGVLGSATYQAVKKFQKKQGLAQGPITYEVLEKLGVTAI